MPPHQSDHAAPDRKCFLSDLTPAMIQKSIHQRLETPSPRGGTLNPASVRREFGILRSIFNWAVRMEMLDKPPTQGVLLPKEPEARERTASKEDIERLLFACAWDGKSVPKNSTQLIMLTFLLACKTGMRAGETLNIEESWIDGSLIHLPKKATKTRVKRDVALTDSALRLLQLAKAYNPDSERIFSVLNDYARDALFSMIRDKADLGPVKDSNGKIISEGLRFHDSRATFATWAASPNPRTGAPRLDVLTLARQTGHRNLKMLQKYYRPTAATIVERLNKSEENDEDLIFLTFSPP